MLLLRPAETSAAAHVGTETTAACDEDDGEDEEEGNGAGDDTDEDGIFKIQRGRKGRKVYRQNIVVLV